MALPTASASWQLSSPALGAAAVALLLFGRAFLRLRRRGRSDSASWWRLPVFAAAALAALLALVSPLDGAAEKLVSAHMLQHVLIGDLAPALGLAALRGPLLFLALPRGLLRVLARAGPLREGLRVLARPGPAFCAWAAAVGGWHVPALYEAALAFPLLHQLQHLTFFLGGVLVWWQLVDPARREALAPLARLGYAVLLLAVGGALVNVLVFTGPLYPSYAALSTRPFALSAAGDQQLAGLVMLGEQWLTVGTLVAVLLARRPRALLALGGGEASGRRHPFAL